MKSEHLSLLQIDLLSALTLSIHAVKFTHAKFVKIDSWGLTSIPGQDGFDHSNLYCGYFHSATIILLYMRLF